MNRKIERITALFLAGTMLLSITSCGSKSKKAKISHKSSIEEEQHQDTTETIDSKLVGLPNELVDLYYKNPETQDFVLSYYNENYSHVIDLDEFSNSDTIPHFLQWDARWGFEQYNGNFLALTGCGPTCLSMVAVYLTGNAEYSPLWMANFLDEHGYAIEDVGTAWSIFDDGVQCIDLYGYKIGTTKETIMTYLLSGYPIICSMGPGDFTDAGHFVVLSGYDDGKVSILDPNSNIRSTTWSLDDINDQMAECWAMYVGDSIIDSPDYCETQSTDEDCIDDDYVDDEVTEY